MIALNELRIGNYVVNSLTNKIVEVLSVSNEGFIEFEEEKSRKKIDLTNISPLYINDNLLSQLVEIHILLQDIEHKHIYYFAKSTTTYFLVNLPNEAFVGMIDTNLPENYRRLTRPFEEYHKLQNAYFSIYNNELLKFNTE